MFLEFRRPAGPRGMSRSIRPFHRDGVDRPRQLVDRATVPPPGIGVRALRCQNDSHRPHTRVCELSLTSRRESARRARARALLRPFRCDGVGRARRLVIQTTVPPPGTHCPSPKMPQRPPPPAYTSVRALVHLSAIERSTPGAPECRERCFDRFAVMASAERVGW